MKEGASNCVERHLNLNDCDTSLLWTYSQVGHKCCFHSQRITPRAVRRRTYVYIRRWRVAIVNYDSRSQRWSRKGKARSKDSESGKPRRHIGLQKDLGYSRRSCEVRPCLAPPQMTAQLGHFQLLTPRGNPKRVYVYSFAISRHFLCFFWLVAIRLVGCDFFCSGVLRKRGKCCAARAIVRGYENNTYAATAPDIPHLRIYTS